jgi:hypothetical protein
MRSKHPVASYSSALQTIALFGTNLKRFPAMLGAVVYVVSSVYLFDCSEFGHLTVSIVNLALHASYYQVAPLTREVSEPQVRLYSADVTLSKTS